MRLLNRPLALILAAALIAASVVLMIEVVAAAVHHGPVLVPWATWYHWAHKTRWNQAVVRVWAAILIIAGATLLAVQLKPRRIIRLRLRTGEDATDAALTRAGLAGALRAAATDIDGITGAAVTIRRGRARVTARSAARRRPAAEALRQPVTDSLRSRLDALDLRHPPRLTVHVTPSRSR